MDNHTIILSAPAESFEHGTPIGNGSMGAMLLGRTDVEKIYLSEESIWSCEADEKDGIGFRKKIDSIREMYLSGNVGNIDDFAEENFYGSLSGIKSLEYAGLLTFTYDIQAEHDDYKRLLDLSRGIAKISYKKNGEKFTETAFSSYSDEVTVIKLKSEKKHCLTFNFFRENTDSVNFEDNTLFTTAHTAFGKHHFSVGIKFVTDGKCEFKDGFVNIIDTDTVTIFISITTEFIFDKEYQMICSDILDEADDYDEIRKFHIADFRELFSASDIVFEEDDAVTAMFTDERLKRLQKDSKAHDFALISLYFSFGKYLMISSSRDFSLPANLQGVWAEKLENPWDSDYHLNINLQMNYWLPEVANISECHMPLFDYMNKYLLNQGKETAKSFYNCHGTVAHHISDIYGFTSPADGPWGIWPLGGAWLSFHMWEHYLFTNDIDFLRHTAYDYIHECVLFFLDYMFKNKDGVLLSGPSMSPENRYFIDSENKESAYLAFSPTMDTEIIGGLLRNYIKTEELLNISPKDKKRAEEALASMPKLKTGKHGQLMEWLEDYDEPEPGHRHISHAFALYPDNAITENTPELEQAIRKTIERRLANGSGHTGWSRAWLINIFARLRDGETTFEQIRMLLTNSTLENLLDIHPPFQIDGNFGGAAGIAEALIQSHNGYIAILPAVIPELSGQFRRLKARGNIEVSCKFKNGIIYELSFFSEKAQSIKVKMPYHTHIESEASFSQTNDGLISFDIKEEQTVTFFPNKP